MDNVSAFDPNARDFIENPFPVLDHLREHDPICWNPRLSAWVLTRYDHVKAGLKDPRLSADRVRPFLARYQGRHRPLVERLVAHIAKWAPFNDGPVHARLRGLLVKAMPPGPITRMQPTIEAIVDELLDIQVARGGEVDLMQEYARLVPARVIGEVLGFPRADVTQVKQWSDDVGEFVNHSRTADDKYRRADAGREALEVYFAAMIREREAMPRDDGVTRMITAGDKEAISAEDVIGCCAHLCFAGHESTTQLIGTGLVALLRHPDAMEELRRSPDNEALWSSALDEMLRWDGPLLMMARVAAEDIELEGRQIRAGDRVFLFFAAAHRDPRVFADPARFDIHREGNRHFAFGNGPHFCVGATLARLQARIALTRVLTRLGRLDFASTPIQWKDTFVVRGLSALPVRIQA